MFHLSSGSAKVVVVQAGGTALTMAAMFAELVCAGGQRAYVDGVFETVHEEAVKRNG